MRRRNVILVVLASILIAGCSVNKEFVMAVDGYSKVILPEYKDYIANDPNLSERTKQIRMQTADKLQKLVDEARGE